MNAGFGILALLLSASVVIAQTSQPATGQAQGQPGAKTVAPNNSPSGSTQSNSSGAAQSSQPAPAAKRVLQPKSTEEYQAYQQATVKTDPAEMASAADAFAAKFPNSDLKELLYVRAMNLYQQNNNTEQEIAMGRKAIAMDATDPVPLIHVASALAETTRDTDMDREERLKEAAKDAQAAINNIDAGLQIPPNTPPEKVAAVKTGIIAMSYETLGMVALNEKDYAGAEQALVKAVNARKDSPDAVVYLRLSVAQDHLEKYQQALESANKAVELGQSGSVVQSLAKQQQARLQKLISGGAASPAPGPSAGTAGAVKPAPTQPSSSAPTTPPH